MSDLRELYQEAILDHSKSPRNFGDFAKANHKADGYNPLCGDRITLFLDIENNVIKSAHFRGSGCAISTASASMMTEAVKGKTIDEIEQLFDEFHGLMTGQNEQAVDGENLGKLMIFSGVREFPMRVKCATLAWHTLRAAYRNERKPVSTE
jgi:nitrogen fixation NifU-like protein